MIILALWDAMLLAGSYNILFWRRFERWPGVTGSVASVVAIWLGVSYLLGRYSESIKKKDKVTTDTIKGNIVVSAIVLAILVIGSWGINSNDPRSVREFVGPILGVSGIGSLVGQLTHRRSRQAVRRWRVLATASEYNILIREVMKSSLEADVDIELIEEGNKSLEEVVLNTRDSGFAIGNDAQATDEVIEAILDKRGEGATVCSITSWAERYLQRIPPELFTTRWLAQAEECKLQPGNTIWRVKRFGDLSIGLILLAMSLPVLMLAAVLIKLEDGGPVFYGQVRTGLFGRPFRIWKLRSMMIEAEKDGPRWSKSGDTRVTRVGYWLRITRIDELPQLAAVLSGEMSLIGPRPERPEIESVLERRLAHYRVRHWIRPGLSGWAQVCYPYGASIEDSRAKLSYDLYYLRNASLALDILILIKTIKLIINREGATAKPGSVDAEENNWS